MPVSPFVRLTLQSKVVSVTSYAVSHTFVNSKQYHRISVTQASRLSAGRTVDEVGYGSEVCSRGEEDDQTLARVDERSESRPVAGS